MSGFLAARQRQPVPLPPAGGPATAAAGSGGGLAKARRREEGSPGALPDPPSTCPEAPRATSASSAPACTQDMRQLAQQPGLPTPAMRALPCPEPGGRDPLLASASPRTQPQTRGAVCAIVVSAAERQTSLAGQWERMLPASPAAFGPPALWGTGPGHQRWDRGAGPILTCSAWKSPRSGCASRQGWARTRGFLSVPAAPCSPGTVGSPGDPRPHSCLPAQGRGCSASRRGSRRGRGSSRFWSGPSLRKNLWARTPAPGHLTAASPALGSDTLALNSSLSRARASCPGLQKPNPAPYR